MEEESFEVDEEFLSEVAVKLQKIVRRFIYRARVINLIQQRFEKIYDPRRKCFYYYDTSTDTSSWLKPLVLKDRDVEKISPTYTPDAAADIITSLYRRLRALRRVQRLYAQGVEQVVVEDSTTRFYRMLGASTTFTKLPRFMYGTLSHPHPGEEQEDGSQNEDSLDEDYDSGGCLCFSKNVLSFHFIFSSW